MSWVWADDILMENIRQSRWDQVRVSLLNVIQDYTWDRILWWIVSSSKELPVSFSFPYIIGPRSGDRHFLHKKISVKISLEYHPFTVVADKHYCPKRKNSCYLFAYLVIVNLSFVQPLVHSLKNNCDIYPFKFLIKYIKL
jgi:hypothetical protein